MNATTHTLTRFTPLALCLALAACGGGSSDGGQLGTIDPIPLPLDEDYAPVAARLAVSYPALIAEIYNDLFDSVDEIRNECDDFLEETTEGDITRLSVTNCLVQIPGTNTYYERRTNLLLFYTADTQASDPVEIDIQHFEDDISDIVSPLQNISLTRTSGTLTTTEENGGSTLLITNANTSFTQRKEMYGADNSLLNREFTHFLLENYQLEVAQDINGYDASHTGRLTIDLGSILAYVDIETTTAMRHTNGDSCPSLGNVTITGADGGIMTLSFNNDDITVEINGNSELYTCEQFTDWLEEAE
jgi:hypothetical protein